MLKTVFNGSQQYIMLLEVVTGLFVLNSYYGLRPRRLAEAM